MFVLLETLYRNDSLINLCILFHYVHVSLPILCYRINACILSVSLLLTLIALNASILLGL